MLLDMDKETINFLTSKPVRIDSRLFSPEMLNEYVSKKQIKCLLEIVKHSYFGHLHIVPSEWKDILDTTYDTACKLRNRFVRLGVITHVKDYEFRFNYYKDMVNDTKGYVKLYKFFFNPFFENLSLPAMRLCLYIVAELSKKSTFSKTVLELKLDELYHREEDKRLFPIANKCDLKQYLEEIKVFFNMDSSQIEKGSVIVTGIKEHLDETIEVTDMYKYVKVFLEEQARLVYVHDYHLNQFVKTYDNYARSFGYSECQEAFTRAFNRLSSPEASDMASYIRALFYHAPESKEIMNNYSEAMKVLVSEFLDEEFMNLTGKIARRAEKVDYILKFDALLNYYPNDIALKVYSELYEKTQSVNETIKTKIDAIQEFFIHSFDNAIERMKASENEGDKNKVAYRLLRRFDKLRSYTSDFSFSRFSKLANKYFSILDEYPILSSRNAFRMFNDQNTADELPF